MSFNLKKISQQPQGNPYMDRFDPGAKIKNGNIPGNEGQGVPLTPDNSAEANQPLGVDAIIKALSEIATSGNLSDASRNDSKLKAELQEILQDQSQAFTGLVTEVGGGVDLVDFTQWFNRMLEQTSPLLTGDTSTKIQTAKHYLELFKNYKYQNKSNEQQGMNTMASNSFNLYKISADEKGEEKSKSKTSYEKEQTDDQKKKHGGNPFRVLMGIVGKLLDKGWSSHDIVRHVKRTIKFEPKTIKDCIKIVKQYNKKKHYDNEQEKKAFNLRNIVIASAIERASEESDLKDTYDVERNLEKQSTRELIIRLKYLQDAKDFDESKDNDTRTNGPKGDLSSCGSEISKVEAALKTRGWSAEDITQEKKIIQSDRYYPFNSSSI